MKGIIRLELVSKTNDLYRNNQFLTKGQCEQSFYYLILNKFVNYKTVTVKIKTLYLFDHCRTMEVAD